MNLEDLLIRPEAIATAPWQLGQRMSHEIEKDGVTLIFCSDERGCGCDEMPKDFSQIRRYLYHLSQNEIMLNIGDLGDVISGKTLEDTHYAVEELVLKCLEEGSLPVVIGGGVDMSVAVYQALARYTSPQVYTQINAQIHLGNTELPTSEYNALSQILTHKKSPKIYYHLAYQRHLNEKPSIQLLQDLEAEAVGLSKLMGQPHQAEPYLRWAQMVSLSADAMESVGAPLSKHPQPNGLNAREICVLMKEIGVGERLQALGLFNYDFNTANALQQQLLAQMLWYFFEGLSIRKSHPKEKKIETFVVLDGEASYYFKREMFTGLWYFGEAEDLNQCLPCMAQDYQNAKEGVWAERLIQFLNR